MGAVEGLYVFDEHNNIILEHVYTGRPASSSTLLPLYLGQPTPRPSLAYFPNVTPPTILFSNVQDRLLFLVPTSTDTEPLLVLEFLHRVADALEDFLGAPLLASKIEANYDVVVQIVVEMCDAGIVCNTEPNALREVVEVPNWMGNLLGGFGLPAASPALGRTTPSLHAPNASSFASGISNTTTSVSGSVVPWRRANVRHTSNELYVDIIEQLSVVLAPSGRPISAFANGTIAFNAKISGVPDLLLRLTAPGGKAGIQRAMDLPCFHQCVRLSRWRDQPGELSFVPPDGRFVLAGYECDLLPDLFDGKATGEIATPKLSLPASIDMLPAQGAYGDELEVRLTLPLRNTSSSMNANGAGTAAQRALGSAGRPGLNSTNSGSGLGGPAVEEILVVIPIATIVRNVSDIRCTKGEAHFSPADAALEWRISTREAATIGSGGATMRCTIIGSNVGSDEHSPPANLKLTTDTYDYDEDADSAYQQTNGSKMKNTEQPLPISGHDEDASKRRNAALMPQSASLSFSVRGWLASGIKVDTLGVNTKTSKGLGAGVTPYKGVKYHTVSRRGIEARC